MMPGMDGFEVCRRIKSAPETMHMPVVMVTALDQPSDKVQGLEAGADDFLTKPVDDIALITRVKNLARLKALNDEMLPAHGDRRRDRPRCPARAPRLAEAEGGGAHPAGRGPASAPCSASWPRSARCTRSMSRPTAGGACARSAKAPCDLLIVSLNLAAADGLRLCSQVRSLERTRHLPIIVVVRAGRRAAPAARARHGRQRLSDAPDRPQRAAGARAHADQAQALRRPPARPAWSAASSSPSPIRSPGLYNRRYMETHRQGARRAGARLPAARCRC